MMSSCVTGRNTAAVVEQSYTREAGALAVTEKVWSSVAEIDVKEWDQVRPADDVFMDVRLLQALETSMSATSRFRYILYQNALGQPIAIAVLCTFVIDIGVLADDAWSRWALDRLRRISPWFVNYRILFCGLPLSACQSSLRFAPGADHSAILKLLDQTLRRLARQDGARVIVLKEFADEELPPQQPLQELGYRQADSLPTHIIHVKSNTFDGFLMDARSNRRSRIRHSMKKFAASGMEFITTSDFATIQRLFTTETYQMYSRAVGRSATKFEYLPPEFFLEMARQLPDCCEFIFALKGERVHAFAIALWSVHEYRGLFMGYDESVNEGSHLYFNLVFRGIADAAQHGCKVVEAGQNSSEFKRVKLGAVQSRRSIYVRGGGPFMNWVIGLFFKQLFPARPLIGDAPAE